MDTLERTIEIVNIKTKGDLYSDEIYVGRGFHRRHLPHSPLHNPFHIGIDGNREEVVSKYEQHLRREMRTGNVVICAELRRLAEIYQRTGSLKLTCWCAPRSCHANIIATIIKEIVK